MLQKLTKLALAGLAALAVSGPALAANPLTMSQDELVAQAKSEGQLTWYVWYFQPEFREQVKAFEDEYGIKVNIPDITSGDDAVKKVLAEAGRDTGDVDVLAMGGDTTNRLDMQKLFYGPILPVMPDHAALTDKINGGDGKGYAVAYWGNQTGMAYDSNRVRADTLPQTIGQLSDWMKAHPGQLGFNYENGGSGPSFIENVVRNVLGLKPGDTVEGTPDMSAAWKWFNDRKDEFVITGSNADSLTRLNSGEFLMVPAWEDQLFSLQKSNTVGKQIKLYIPEWGMNGGGNVVAIPANAPHKAAALLFAEWLTSAKTQTAFNQRFGTAPTNTGADDSKALVPNSERVNSRLWTTPLSDKQTTPGFIDNVVQN